MSRRRYLSTDAGRDKALMELARQEPLAVSFYLLSVPAAGDDGALPATDPDELLWEVWPALSRLVDGACVQAWIARLLDLGLWQRAPDGQLRFPPRSYYKYQTYIRDERRCLEGRDIHPERGARTPAQNAASIDIERKSAQNSAEQRTSAREGAERRFASPSFRSSDSPSASAEGVQGEREPAEAGDIAPDKPAQAATKERAPTPAPKPNKYGDFIDAVRAAGLPYERDDADAKTVKNSTLTAAQLAEVYIALARGDFGDEWQRDHLSVQVAAKAWNAYQTAKALPRRPRAANGRLPEQPHVPNPGPPPVEWDEAKAAASDAERERTRQELVGSGVLSGRRAPPNVNGAAKPPPPDPAAAEERLREKERRLLAEGVLTAEQVQTARRARQPSQVTAGA